MKPEQIKRVAELVCHQYDWELSDADEVIRNESPARWHSFSPSFSDVDWQRSRALAVLEWLCRKFGRMVAESATDKSLIPKIGVLAAHICMYTDTKDIDGLMRMVLELSDE